MTVSGAWAVASLGGLLALGGCAGTATSSAAGTVTVTAPPVTVAAPPVTAEVTRTVTVTVTREHTLTQAVREATQVPADVTASYVAWRKAHHGSYAEDATQYRLVISASLQSGVLEVLTSMRSDWGGWNCEGEPRSLGGESIRYVRILHTDGSVFRSCPAS